MKWYTVQYAIQDKGEFKYFETRVLAENAPHAKKLVRKSMLHVPVKFLMLSARADRGSK